MERASRYLRLAFGLLAAWILCGPSAADAWLLVIRNLTNDAMGVCYSVSGMGTSCFGSIEVPAHATVPANTGATCVARYKVTRVRDGQAQVLSHPSATGCGDRQLLIRPAGAGFSLDTP
jgi:hypothetical protein